MTADWEDADDDHKHINYLETVAIRLGLLMVLALKCKPGQTFIVWTDNTTAQAAITNRRSKNKAVNNEWKCIQLLLIHSQLDIVARRVTSEDNTADELSRGIVGDCKEEDRMILDIPPDLTQYFVNSR